MKHDSSSNDDLTPDAAPTELQQLEAALRAKVISPELFATLTAKLRQAGTAAASPGPTTEFTELPSLLSFFESAPIALVPAPGPPPPLPAPVAAPFVARPQRLANSPAPTARISPSAAARVAPPQIAAPVVPPAIHVPAPEAEPAAPPQRSALTTVLAALGGATLLGLGFYLYVDRSHPSENLTGPQPAPTESAAPVAPPQPVAAVVAVPETVRVAAPTLPVPDSSTLAAAPSQTAPDENPAATPAPQDESAEASAPNNHPAAPATAVVPAPVPAAPEPGDDDATQKIRTVLAAYYGDLFAPPLAAENYFAPQVERLYIQRNLTPAQINATITQTFFPDNKKAVYQVGPGTLRVSAPGQDGSRTATYSEACRLFRVSKGRYQHLRTQVRVRFDADYRITFMRQEKILENVFE